MNSTQFEQFKNSAIIYSNKHVPFLLSGSKLLTADKCNFITDAQVYYMSARFKTMQVKYGKKTTPQKGFSINKIYIN